MPRQRRIERRRERRSSAAAAYAVAPAAALRFAQSAHGAAQWALRKWCAIGLCHRGRKRGASARRAGRTDDARQPRVLRQLGQQVGLQHAAVAVERGCEEEIPLLQAEARQALLHVLLRREGVHLGHHGGLRGAKVSARAARRARDAACMQLAYAAAHAAARRARTRVRRARAAGAVCGRRPSARTRRGAARARGAHLDCKDQRTHEHVAGAQDAHEHGQQRHRAARARLEAAPARLPRLLSQQLHRLVLALPLLARRGRRRPARRAAHAGGAARARAGAAVGGRLGRCPTPRLGRHLFGAELDAAPRWHPRPGDQPAGSRTRAWEGRTAVDTRTYDSYDARAVGAPKSARQKSGTSCTLQAC